MKVRTSRNWIRILIFPIVLVLLFTVFPFADFMPVPNTAMKVKAAATSDNNFLIGAGKSDITGPITEISTGYNSPGTVENGLAMRLYARAFIITDPDSEKRVVLVSAEMVHMYESVIFGVIKELQSMGLGSYYNENNVMLSCTHDHSAPSNYSWYTLYNGVNGTVGFDKLQYQVVTHGIALAIEKAHNSLTEGTVQLSTGNVENAAYNRSYAAYKENKDLDDYNDDVNKEMILLKFKALDGREIGELNWFGAHGTAMPITNTLVHSDAKGYAAYEFEKKKDNSFIAAFAQSECGDVSPNKPDPTDITAPFLRPNDEDKSLSVLDNPVIEGNSQLNAAIEIYNKTGSNLSSNIEYRHTYVDFNDISNIDQKYIGDDYMPYDDPSQAKTEVATIGAAFLAGDEEGAPVNYAKEGEIRNTFTNENGTWVKQNFDLSTLNLDGLENYLGSLWPLAQNTLGTHKYEDVNKEKVVLLPVGDVDDYWPVNSDIPFVQTQQPLQIFTVGELAIVGVPFEVTTMEARRIKSVLLNTLNATGINTIVLSTLTNSYSQYLTTREEFAAQNFEGSFNLYGPWSGAALTQELDKLCSDIVNKQETPQGQIPQNLSDQQFVETWVSTSGVVQDTGNFGNIVTDVNETYHQGDTVSVVFEGSHPRNVAQLKADGELNEFYEPDDFTYLEIQQKQDAEEWSTIYTDSDPYTTYTWKRVGGNLSGDSQVTIEWLLRDAQKGTYRVKYNGLSKNLLGAYDKFTGYSNSFEVTD